MFIHNAENVNDQVSSKATYNLTSILELIHDVRVKNKSLTLNIFIDYNVEISIQRLENRI